MTFQCVCRSSLCFWKNKFYSHFWLHQIKWRPILIKLTIASRAFSLQSRGQSIPRLFSSFNSSIFYLYLAPSYFKSPPLSITTSSRLKFVIFKIQKKKISLIITKTVEVCRSVSCLTKIVIEILPPG